MRMGQRQEQNRVDVSLVLVEQGEITCCRGEVQEEGEPALTQVYFSRSFPLHCHLAPRGSMKDTGAFGLTKSVVKLTI